MIMSYEADDFRNFFEPPQTAKKNCFKCMKEFEIDSMMRHLCPIYEPDKISVCWGCFKKELKERKLTEKEIEQMVDKRVRDEKYSSTFAPIGWWEGFTDEQKEQLDKAYKEYRRKEREDREAEIRKEYYSKAKGLVTEAGNDITGIVALLLRKIDEKTFNRGEILYK